MTDTYEESNCAKPGDLDRSLDAALAKYSAVEPRAGLEERVLANLRAERAKSPDRACWRWSAAAALAAVVIVAIALGWRSGRPSHPAIANHPPPTTEAPKFPEAKIASNFSRTDLPERGPMRRTGLRRSHPSVAIVAEPKLDQFPSPRPLSEQEKILLEYVAQHPAEAALIAQAQTELRERDEKEELERYGPPPAGTEPQNRQQFDSPNL